jgi:hypothetical protein
MAKLKSAQRNALPSSDFAGPGRSYPIPDASHGRDALSRASANASPSEAAIIRERVHKKFPEISVSQLPKRKVPR